MRPTYDEVEEDHPLAGDDVAVDLARAIDRILLTVAPAALLQWSESQGQDVALMCDLAPRRGPFVIEVPDALRAG